MYSSATAAVVLFSIYSRSSPYSTPPNDPSCATQQNVQQQDVRGCIAASYWDFHVFTIPRHIGVEVAVEVGVWARSFADETLCRVGRAWRRRAVRRRAVAWRSGNPFRNGAHWNRHSCEDPKRDDEYVTRIIFFLSELVRGASVRCVRAALCYFSR